MRRVASITARSQILCRNAQFNRINFASRFPLLSNSNSLSERSTMIVRRFSTSTAHRQESDLIVEMTKQNYNEEISNMNQILVIDFSAEWCGPCQTFTPVLEKLIKERKGVFKLLKVDTDKEKEIAAAFQVSSLPSLFFLFRKRIVGQKIEGALPEQEIAEQLDSIYAALKDEVQSPAQDEQQSSDDAPKTPQQKLDIANHLISIDQIDKAQNLLSHILTDDAPSMDPAEKPKIIPSTYSALAMTYLLTGEMEHTKDVLDRIKKEYPASLENIPAVKSTASLYEIYVAAGDAMRALASDIAQSIEPGTTDIASLVINHPFSTELREKIEKNPKDFDSIYKLSLFYFLNGMPTDALDYAFMIAKKGIRWNNLAAKNLILNYANILVDKKEAEAVRRKLAMYLYV